MVCTFVACVPLTPAAAALGIRCRFWKGRNVPRSKMLPEVDVETLPALAGEHLPPARQVVDRLRASAA